MWILGGLSNSGFYNDVWSSPDGTNWMQVTASAPWSARTGFGAVVFNGQMWVLGGNDGNNLNDVWASPDGTNWTEVTAAAPWSPREWFGAVAFNNQMWVLGGNNGNNLNDVWSSPDGTNWTQVMSAASWSQRSEFGSVMFNDLIWVLGGCCNLNDVWALGSLPPPVASFTAAPTNGFAPLSVTFTDTSTGLIDNRLWDFGDGSTTNLTTAGVAYTYLTAGVYTVTEVVAGPLGVSTNEQPNYITVLSCAAITSPPPAVISISPASLSRTALQGQDGPGQELDVWDSAANCSILNYTISSSAPWLSVSPTNGTSDGLVNTHTVTYATASLIPGQYNAVLTITSADATNSPQDVPVSLNVLPLVVSNTGDSGAGTLRQAIVNANSGIGGGTITFSNVTGTITLTSGDLVITNSMSIVGPGSAELTIHQTTFPYKRVLTISNSTATVSISGLTILGGTPDDYPYNPNNAYLQLCGGGIYNAATLFLADCAVLGNSTRSSPLYFPINRTGDGGGIYNVGALTMSNCTVIGNSTGSPFFQGSSQSFNAGRGAGIYNAGVLTISGGTISGNSTGFGLWGVDGYATGNGGDGGGIYNGGSLMVSESAISSNSCGGGGGSDFDWWGSNGGSGGGIAGGGTFSNCTIYANSAGNGGYGGNGGPYAPFYGNGAPGGSGGSGGGVSGGGIFVNCTIYGNSAGSGGNGGYAYYYNGGNGGYGGNAGNGGGVDGGGTLINCTIASNSTAQGGSAGGGWGVGVSGQPGSPGSGGGIGGSQLLNTIVANNSAAGSGPDVSGNFASLGHNLIGISDGSSGFGASGDLLGSGASPMNAGLGPLQNNGGPTPTCALLSGSPAIDAGNDAVLSAPYDLTTDQRGFPRKSGSHVDIGAYEYVCSGGDVCDGIPDWWRAQYFGGGGNTTNDLSCATCDADGTGQDNLFKFLAGLDPTNPSSIFGITAIARESNDVLVTWTCAGGHSYVLQNTRSTAMIAQYNTNFFDASPVIAIAGTGPSATNYLDVGAATAQVLPPPSGQISTTSTVPSTVSSSAIYTRGITDSLGNALPIGSLLMLGTFSISDATIQSNFLAGNISAIMSNFTPYSTPFRVGDGTDQPASWDVSLSAPGFAGQKIYLLTIDAPTLAVANHLGIYAAPSWVFPQDGCDVAIDLEDVTDFVIGARGGSLTLNLVLGGETYTFNDTAKLSVLPGRILFYRVRLAQ
jgi:PKD repeat protein